MWGSIGMMLVGWTLGWSVYSLVWRNLSIYMSLCTALVIFFVSRCIHSRTDQPCAWRVVDCDADDITALSVAVISGYGQGVDRHRHGELGSILASGGKSSKMHTCNLGTELN